MPIVAVCQEEVDGVGYFRVVSVGTLLGTTAVDGWLEEARFVMSRKWFEELDAKGVRRRALPRNKVGQFNTTLVGSGQARPGEIPERANRDQTNQASGLHYETCPGEEFRTAYSVCQVNTL
jgi:hypothetical protein